MARFKNISQPNYGQLIGFEEDAASPSVSQSEIERKQLYLNPIAAHSNGLSDLGNTVSTESIPSVSAFVREPDEPRSTFNQEPTNIAQKIGAKNKPSTKNSRRKKNNVSINDSNNKVSSSGISQNDSDDDLDTSGWSTDELPRRKLG